MRGLGDGQLLPEASAVMYFLKEDFAQLPELPNEGLAQITFCSSLFLHFPSAKAVRILYFLPGSAAVAETSALACLLLTLPSTPGAWSEPRLSKGLGRSAWLRPFLGIMEMQRQGRLCSRRGSCNLCGKECCSNETKHKTTPLIRVSHGTRLKTEQTKQETEKCVQSQEVVCSQPLTCNIGLPEVGGSLAMGPHRNLVTFICLSPEGKPAWSRLTVWSRLTALGLGCLLGPDPWTFASTARPPPHH